MSRLRSWFNSRNPKVEEMPKSTEQHLPLTIVRTPHSIIVTTGAKAYEHAALESGAALNGTERAVGVVEGARFANVVLDKPHEVIFFGEDRAEVERFVIALMKDFAFITLSESKRLSQHQAFEALLKTQAAKHFPDKYFWTPMAGFHELRVNRPSDRTAKQAVRSAAESGAALEFGYPTRKGSERQPAKSHVRVHRAQVRSIDRKGFTAQHKRGVRRYSFGRLSWAKVEETTGNVMEHVPKLTIRLKAINANREQIWLFELDRVRSRNE
jgi:hypothetical protein